MGLEENKAIIHRWNDEMWNKGNADVVDELIAPNCVNHIDPPPTDVRTYWREQLARFQAAFSDSHHTIEDTIAEGDKVVIRWTGRVTHTGEAMGIPATGKRIEVKGISIYRLSGGQIVEDWSSSDDLGLMRQLGAIPPAGT